MSGRIGIKNSLSILLRALLATLAIALSSCTISSLVGDINTDVSYNLTKLELETDPVQISSLDKNLKVSKSTNQSGHVVKDVYIKVTVYDVKPAPKAGFHPELKVTGSTQITSTCGTTNASGITYCMLSSQKTGKYLVGLSNANVKSSLAVSFYDGNNSVTVETGTGYANGQDATEIDVTVRDPSGNISPGAVPTVTVSGPGNPQITCTPADNNGVSKCYVTNTSPGDVNVNFTNPLISSPVVVSFDPSSLTPTNPNAHVDDNGGDASTVTNAGAKATVAVQLPANPDGTPQTGVTPVLSISPPSNTSYVCAPSNASGVSTCTITSSEEGTKTVSVTSPSGIDETVNVNFGDKYSNATVVTPTTTDVPANGTSTQVVSVTVRDDNGNPISGEVPQGTVTGSGANTMTCTASDTNGVSTCSITSTQPGDKTVTFTNPAVTNPVTVNFSESDITIDTNRADAGNGDQNVITIVTKDGDGNIITDTTPTLSITGPGNATYTCTPSDNSGNSTCYITADESGDYHLSVTSPAGSQENTDIVFSDSNSTASLTKATANADFTDTAVLSMSIYTAQMLPRIGFTPTIKATGTGQVVVTCPATGVLGGTDCTIKSDTWGDKVLEIDDPPMASRYVVRFINTFSSMTETSSGSLTSYANAPGAFAKLTVTLKSTATTAMVGVIPKLSVNGTGTFTSNCTPSDSSGFSYCNISSDTVGSATVSLAEPFNNIAPLTMTFLNKTRSCSVDFGGGSQTWVGPGFNDFSSCQNVTCNVGYTWSSNQCMEFDAPQGGDFNINGGATGTSSALVTLNVTLPTDASPPIYMLASSDASDNSSWVPAAATMSYTLSAGDGIKTIYMKFKDRFDNISAIVTKTIRLDATAPVGGGFNIVNNGNNVVGDPNIYLNVICPTDISGGVQSATGEAAHPSAWIDCISSMNYMLTNVSGPHTVYMAFRDSLHNTTSDYNHSVILDITGPTSTVTYSNGYLNTLTTGLSITAIDDYSSVAGCSMQVQETTLSNGVLNTWGPWTPLTRTGNGCGTQSFTGQQGHAYKFQGRSVDEWGNIGAYNQPPLILKFDTTAPVSGSITNPTINQTTTPIVLTLNKGSDPESGMSAADGNYMLQVQSATNVDGVCQNNWSGWSGALGGLTAAATSYTFTGAQGNCYNFRYTVTNNAGLTSVYTTSSPSRIDYTYAWVITTGWYGCTAPAPSWQIGGWYGCTAPAPSWSYGAWSDCPCGVNQTQYRSASCPTNYGTENRSVTCPTNYGTEYRGVICQRSDGATAADAYCGGGKPATSETCSNTNCGAAPASSEQCSNSSCAGSPTTSQLCTLDCGGDSTDGGGDDGGSS
ncbi:MAG TPA: hypothetical protein VF412_12745 [Bdellovibrio sp.]|uniref:Ig-like domain-containing protein n=1 Tax=Bdellovibrio sp. TaxID=28201 RepID=UPI002F2142F5